MVHITSEWFNYEYNRCQLRELRQAAWLPGLLTMPFIGKVSGYAINRREWE